MIFLHYTENHGNYFENKNALLSWFWEEEHFLFSVIYCMMDIFRFLFFTFFCFLTRRYVIGTF